MVVYLHKAVALIAEDNFDSTKNNVWLLFPLCHWCYYVVESICLSIMHHVIPCFRIVESKNPDYAVGDYITAMFGWRTHTIAAADQLKLLLVTKINPALSQSKSTAIGVLGMPGYE